MAMDKTFVPTVPSSGHDLPHQCLIERNKKTSTYRLYLSVKDDLMAKGKLLLVAQKLRRGLHSEYIIFDDLSQESNAYVGKLRSDFFGTNYTIHDSDSVAKPSSKQISPEVPAGRSEVGRVTYKLHLLKGRGPRVMACSLNINETLLDDPNREFRNKTPKWHDGLKFWCLNFYGRVIVPSVKNFQLLAANEDGDDEKVLLQFGRVGDDTFTMDYGEPFSVFQAFAICLTTFGPKLGCE